MESRISELGPPSIVSIVVTTLSHPYTVWKVSGYEPDSVIKIPLLIKGSPQHIVFSMVVSFGVAAVKSRMRILSVSYTHLTLPTICSV